MKFSLPRWRPRHLLIAWGVYWIVLFITALWPGVVAALSAINGPPGHGNISATIGDGGVVKIVATGDSVAWTGSASLTNIALAIAGPPLVLWVLWFIARGRRPAPVVREPDSLSPVAPMSYGAAPGTPSPIPSRDRDGRAS